MEGGAKLQGCWLAMKNTEKTILRSSAVVYDFNPPWVSLSLNDGQNDL